MEKVHHQVDRDPTPENIPHWIHNQAKNPKNIQDSDPRSSTPAIKTPNKR